MIRTVRIKPATVALALAALSVILCLLSILGRLLTETIEDPALSEVFKAMLIFDVNRERSVATWFSSFILLLCALSVGIIASAMLAQRRPYRRLWAGLALLFLGMSIEEIAGIHESLSRPISAFVPREGFLYFGWTLAGLVVVAVVVVVYFRFWLHLDSRTRWLLALGAALYLGGAVGLEMVSGPIYTMHGVASLEYALINTFEELGEMLGAVVMLYAMLAYIVRGNPDGAFTVGVDAATAPQLAPPDRV
jgi:hypothetical protein